MLRRAWLALGVAGLLGAPGPARGQAGPEPTSVPLPPALDRVLRDYEAAWKAGSAERLSQLFAEDGCRLEPGSLPICGRNALRSTVRPGGNLELRAFRFAAADSVAYIVGGYGYPPGAGDRGKFVLALRRTGGGPWLIAADIDNHNLQRPSQ